MIRIFFNDTEVAVRTDTGVGPRWLCAGSAESVAAPARHRAAARKAAVPTGPSLAYPDVLLSPVPVGRL